MAMKGQLLRKMYPDDVVVSPNFDYDHIPPQALLSQVQYIIRWTRPDLIVGSSLGGYYALCSTSLYDGPVWCVNPVRAVVKTMERLIDTQEPRAAHMLELYKAMDQQLFQQLAPHDGQLHFALSTDDEVLGDHTPLLARFPNYGSAVWKDRCGHRFLRFEELKEEIRESL